MNFTRSLLLGVFAAAELGRSVMIRQAVDGSCAAASAFYEQCLLDIRAGTLATGIAADNEARVLDIFTNYSTFGATDADRLKRDLEAELMY